MSSATDAQGRFVAVLAKLCSPLDVESAAAALMSMVPLMHDMPAGVFCGEAAEFCGRKFAVLPNYARLRKTLMEWWDTHRPQVSIASGPQILDPSLSPDDAAAARAWLGARTTIPERDLIGRLDVLRLRAVAAFRYLVANDDGARAIATRHDWIRDPDERQVTPEAARATIQQLQRAIAAQREPTGRPNNALPFSRPMTSPARPLGALTPAQLEAARVKIASPLARPPRSPAPTAAETTANPQQDGAPQDPPHPTAPPPPENPHNGEFDGLPERAAAAHPARLPWEVAQ